MAPWSTTPGYSSLWCDSGPGLWCLATQSADSAVPFAFPLPSFLSELLKKELLLKKAVRPLPAARDLRISCFVDPHPLYYLPPYVIANYLYRLMAAVKPEGPLKCGKGIAALFRPLSTPHVPLHTVVICSECLPDSAFSKALYTDKAGHAQRRDCALHCTAQCKACTARAGLLCILLTCTGLHWCDLIMEACLCSWWSLRQPHAPCARLLYMVRWVPQGCIGRLAKHTER